MKAILTPTDLARSLGVSASSVKRWIDEGRVLATRTPGGHRRISLAEALKFIRRSGHPLVDASALGLDVSDAGGVNELREALEAGDGCRARALLCALHLGGTELADVFDGPLRNAMEAIGDGWRDRPDGIFLEHRATDVSHDAVRHVTNALIETANGPTAVGGAPEGDPYSLPSLMATAIMQAAGFSAVNLGANTPLETLAVAAQKLEARVVWLSVSSRPDGLRPSELASFAKRLEGDGRLLVVGGRRLDDLRLNGHRNVFRGTSMRDLAAVAHGLAASWRQ